MKDALGHGSNGNGGLHPSPYETHKAHNAILEAEYARTGNALKAISGGGPMGLTPDHVRATAEWQAARGAYERAFAAYRNHNEFMTKNFSKEKAAERKARRG